MCMCGVCGVRYVCMVCLYVCMVYENARMFVCGMYKRGVCVHMCSMCVVCTCVWYMSHDIVCGKGERGTFLLQTQRAAVIE